LATKIGWKSRYFCPIYSIRTTFTLVELVVARVDFWVGKTKSESKIHGRGENLKIVTGSHGDRVSKISSHEWIFQHPNGQGENPYIRSENWEHFSLGHCMRERPMEGYQG